jgi:hypothetical protein
VTQTVTTNVVQDAAGGSNSLLDAQLLPGSTTVDVSGTVWDAFTQQPLAGAQVVLGDKPATLTTAAGEFAVAAVAVGAQTLKVSLSTYDDYSAEVNILPGMARLRVGLTPSAPSPPPSPYNLQGTVTLNGRLPDNDNSGATVTASDLNTGREWGRVTTPTSGEYTMFLPPGQYRVTASFDTHAVPLTVTVPGGGRVLTGVDFEVFVG